MMIFEAKMEPKLARTGVKVFDSMLKIYECHLWQDLAIPCCNILGPKMGPTFLSPISGILASKMGERDFRLRRGARFLMPGAPGTPFIIMIGIVLILYSLH